MTLRKRGGYTYGSRRADVRVEVTRYAKRNTYAAHRFAEAECECGGKAFRLALDDTAGAAVRTCAACAKVHPIGDSDEYLEEAELDECECPCGKDIFEITVGVSLYRGSEDVRWMYVGCRCVECKLVAVYGDWKNEYEGARELLAKI